jgi:GxxExxY protein
MWDDEVLTGQIIESIIRVHQVLGPGFLESIYRRALVIELGRRGLDVQQEYEAPVFFEGQCVGNHRLDLVVERRIILELKTIEGFNQAHYAQLRSYLKATGMRVGFLVNFALTKADYRRVELK